MAYDSGEKSYSAAVVVSGKKILSPAGLGEKILSPPNHPYHPRNPTHSPSMSNGRLFLLFLCCSAPLFLVFLMFPCSCAPPVSYPASIACERQTFQSHFALPSPPPPPRSRTIEGDAVRRVAVSLPLLFLCSCAPTVPLFLHSSLAPLLNDFATLPQSSTD